MILVELKEIAESSLGKKVKHAVLTVPAYFNDAQRQALKNAGIIAGLNVLRIINEPSAAAVAYGLERISERDEINIMVCDLGGRSLDISILTIDRDVIEIISTSGITHLGGEDFDQRTLDHFLKLIEKKYSKNLSADRRAVQKLRREIEKAKRALSSTHQTKIEVEGLINGEDFSETLTRTTFEELNNDLFKMILGPIQTALTDSKLKKNQIDEILLIGGSARIPKIQRLIKEFFNGKELLRGINPEEAVSYGAAIQGAVLCGDKEDEDTWISCGHDRVPLSLGIETDSGAMMEVIPKGTFAPARRSRIFTTSQNNQEIITIKVFEGDHPMTKENYLLGELQLTDLQKAPRGMRQIEVIFEIDPNDILSVTAIDIASNKSQKLVISNERGRLSEEEIERMLQEAVSFVERDERAREWIDARNALENYIYVTRNAIDDPENQVNEISEDERGAIKTALKEASDWLSSHENAEKEKFIEQQRALEKICSSISSIPDQGVIGSISYKPRYGGGEL